MNEDNILNKIKDSAQNVETPDSLNPENMMKKIETAEKAETKEKIETTETTEKTETTETPKVFRFRPWMGGVAAACVVLVGVFGLVRSGVLSGAGSSAPGSAGVTTEETAVSTESSSADMEESAAEAGDMASGADETVAQTVNLDQVIKPAESYEQIYSKLEALYVSESRLRSTYGDSQQMTEDAEGEAGGMGSGGYSTTNIQEQGVDEGDMVKTDGQYIYALDEYKVHIIKTDDGQLTEVATISADKFQVGGYIPAMYLVGDKLILLGDYYDSSLDQVAADVAYMYDDGGTAILTYDVSDPANPEKIGEIIQDGNYQESRLVDGHLYVVGYYMSMNLYARDGGLVPYEEIADEGLVPMIQGNAMATSDIYIPEELQNMDYTMLTAIDVEHPDQVEDQKALLATSGTSYMSTENLYLASYVWNGENITNVIKIHFEDGKIQPQAVASISGMVDNSFSMSEYKDHMRVVTSHWKDDGNSVTNLYVMDENMEITGSITNVAPGETLRSVRFLEDKGYFVTFKDVDPLFTVELSDPSNPQIIGSLKVTGFSDYLQFYQDPLLLGIGYEVDEESGERIGFKMSMFDVTDPTDVKEVNKEILTEYEDCPAIYDHHGIIMDVQKGIIGFSANYWDNERGEFIKDYLIYNYSQDQGFTRAATISMNQQESEEFIYDQYIRGLYIEDIFYTVDGYQINAYDMNNQYNPVGEIQF